MTEIADLQDAVSGLSTLLTSQQSLEQTLRQIAEFTVQAIPGADGAGLTLLQGEKQQTVVGSSAIVAAIDDVQYGIHEGPCLTAMQERRTTVAGSLGGDPQWPRFGPRVGRMGVHSALSLPLLVGDELIGALNVYAYAKDAFDASAVRLGEVFARSAAVNVQTAHVLADTKRTMDQLSAALTSRSTIDQALGLIMGRSGVNPDEAFERLRIMSQQRNIKIAVLAQRLLDEAVDRARARGRAGPTDTPA